MRERYFEDTVAGNRFVSDTYDVTEQSIKEFAQQFDPQPFHLDRTAAARDVFGGLVASGWHTAAISMRLFVRAMNFAEGAVGMGVDELRWPNPVRPGDTLRLEISIIDARVSRSKPDRGIIVIRNVTKNQRDQTVQTLNAVAMVPRRKS